MLYIEKGDPPKEMTENVIAITKSDVWKRTDEDNTERLRSFFDQLDKQTIRKALVDEQHGLCAYCMKRIEPNDRMNIEHYQPVKGHKDKVLDFNNMLGCCKGGSDHEGNEKRILCCDAAKKNQEITINPWDKAVMNKIRYHRDGRMVVFPEDPVLQKDIDQVLVLNGALNKDGSFKQDTSTNIVMGRRETYKKYERYMNGLNKKYGGNETKIQASIKKKIAEIEKLDQYPEYAGVLLFFLRRRAYGV